ncbi:hypothetical protein A8A10_10035 [Klebsiella pneumoniae]|nr:hypothetical protein A8A10_10035 [Klebsiella pneumoniae]
MAMLFMIAGASLTLNAFWEELNLAKINHILLFIAYHLMTNLRLKYKILYQAYSTEMIMTR